MLAAMTRAPRLFLFDVDGTLINAAGAGRSAIGTAFTRVFGVRADDYAATKVRFDGNTDPTIFVELAEALGLEQRLFASRQAEFLDSYYDALRAEMANRRDGRHVLPGVERLLRCLAAVGDVHLGLLTGNLERSARIKLEPFGLNRFFAHGGFGSDHRDRNEIARIARERAERASGLRFEPGSVTVVGDTERDVDCARANGFRAVALGTGWTKRGRLEAADPDVYLPDLSDLEATLTALGLSAGADYGTPDASTE